MKITLLAGGVGGAKFAKGLRAHLAETAPGAELTIVANVGDDMWLSALKVCPDLDSLMYALAGVNDDERGWGRQGESERVSSELSAYGVGWPWFTLGDLDLGTHIARSGMLRDGLTLTEATAKLCERWRLGARLLPVSDDAAETWVELDRDHPDSEGEPPSLHFEEWWVRLRARVPAARFVRGGASSEIQTPAITAQARQTITEADVVLLAPSNPVVSIGTMTGFPSGAHSGVAGISGITGISGVADALRDTKAPVIGVSPIIGGSPLRGMARECLDAVGVACSAEAVGLGYGARTHGGIIDGWLVDTVDAGALPPLRAAGLNAEAVPLWMTDEATSRTLAADALALAEQG